MSEKREDETQTAFTIRQIREEERERCAMIADDTVTANQGNNDYYRGIRFGAQIVAEAIRALK